MSSYDSMKSKLLPTGLYRLEAHGAVDNELRAYAEGLDPVFEGLEVMERELRLETAESYGLSERERLCGGSTEGLTVAQRRERLSAIEAARASDWRIDGLKRLLQSFGAVDPQITPDFRHCSLTVTLGTLRNADCRSMLERIVNSYAPAHFQVTVQ